MSSGAASAYLQKTDPRVVGLGATRRHSNGIRETGEIEIAHLEPQGNDTFPGPYPLVLPIQRRQPHAPSIGRVGIPLARMAVQGYAHAFDAVLALAQRHTPITRTVILDLYEAPFRPSVDAGFEDKKAPVE